MIYEEASSTIAEASNTFECQAQLTSNEDLSKCVPYKPPNFSSLSTFDKKIKENLTSSFRAAYYNSFI